MRRAKLHPAGRRVLCAGLAMGMAGVLAACSSGNGGGATTGSSSAKPVTLDFWGWQDGQQALVKAFNASHPGVTLKYTKLTDAVTALTTLSNAVKAGNAPCLVQNSAENLTSLVAQGIPADITQWTDPHKADFSAAAYAYSTIQGKVYAVPTTTSPAFTIYRTDVFKKYGLTAPATWSQFIADGKVLAAHGVHITNFAGEDPTSLITLAMQAGAHWYTIDGSSWKVDFQAAASLKAAAVVQQIIDGGLNSSISFADYAAVQRNYDNGGTVTRQISTWQMSGMVKNFTKSDGEWALAPWPTFDGESAAIPAGTNNGAGITVVTKQCKDTAQAAEAALWMSTNPGAVGTMADPATGSGFYPAVADATPYLDKVISAKLLGSNTAAAKPIIVNSVPTIVTGWTYGPDWTAMGQEMASGWAKVMNKQQTAVQLLAHMQQWTVSDLKSRGISVEG
ncbi:multiple sugar transport system substrate-binding protein [Streptomyces sp. 846.5]|nr:extracellular solute-binding protein [Streptomyces sp. 846.5]TDU03399.1 multiple sugar transport system substrate-binding protein [Streptomyces sp. 846.5]